MNDARRSLILVGSTDDADRAARFVGGDADIEADVARPPADGDRGGPGYASVVVAGDLADDAWLSAACRRAATELCAGGRLLVVLADTPQRSELPADVVEAWRVVGAVAEHSSAAVVLARASDLDGAGDTDAVFRSWQHLAALAKHGQVVRTEEADAPDVDAEVAELRRQLDAYRFSVLGRLTTWYWALRGRSRARHR
jgi:hypothetical protein